MPSPPLLILTFLSSLLSSPPLGSLYPFFNIFSALSLAIFAFLNFSLSNNSFFFLSSILFLLSFLNPSFFLFNLAKFSISFFVIFLLLFLISSSNSFWASSFILSILSKFDIFLIYSSTLLSICFILSLQAIDLYLAEAFLLS